MRVVQDPQMQLGQVNIAEIKFDPKSRDDTPKVLMGLQYLYTNLEVRKEVFALLEENFLNKVNKNNGRPGMELWKILVLGVLRLNLNIDYDRLHDLANAHSVIRQMLGHADIFDKYYYNLQTLKDNIQFLTPELLDKINQIVVKSGHALLKKKRKILFKAALTHLFLKRMSIIQRILICFLMPCVKAYLLPLSFLKNMVLSLGDKQKIISPR